jgi:hypothetical protein
MEPAQLVRVLRSAGIAGCNLEDSDHATRGLRDPDEHAEWLRGGFTTCAITRPSAEPGLLHGSLDFRRTRTPPPNLS